MKQSHIELLKCIECCGDLIISKDHKCSKSDDFIEMGILMCLRCGELFPIIDGVGVFFRKSVLFHFLNDHEKKFALPLGL